MDKMKILNIEIDLEDTIQDMFENESSDLSAAIKGQIIREVMNKVLPKMKESVEQQVTSRINAIIEKRVEATVDSVLSKSLESDALIMINREQKTVIKHIQDMFEESHGWNSPHEKIAVIAKKFGQDLKVQYNNLFAMNIVSNLKENGMLKDDVAKMLTKQPEQK